MSGATPGMRRLALFEAPLAGISLIEASAGTGKTYTITGLYLRLLLEADCQVSRILVVTYTKAATEELRDRIRRRLVQARDAFLSGTGEDVFCRQLLERHPDRARAARRLTNAVRGFDEAAIFTIHGFCQRALADGAFESGMPFETELLADEREILEEIVEDFWRRELYGASPLLVEFLLAAKTSPETLLQEMRPHVGRPYLQVLGPADVPDCAAAETAFVQAHARARALWQTAAGQVEELLRNAAGLNANRYRAASLPLWLGLMGDCLAPEAPSLALFDQFEKFTDRHLAKAAKKGQSPPRHPFFTACDALAAARDELRARYHTHRCALKLRLLVYCNAELGIRKRQRQVQSYDDLLCNLHLALAGRQGLAEALRRRYSAALIDEFQDTDPLQYEIFRRIYAGSEQPVFLVGDPKQAIYSFRGADIFAYLKARQDASGRYTLDVNWRSDPELIQAVNAVFETAPRPFLFEGIPFYRAVPAATEREPLLIEGTREPALRFWFLGAAEDGSPLPKGAAGARAARGTAAEIARLLNLGARGTARIGRDALRGGDIAVLVRSHRQGRMVRDELLRLGVPSVQQAQDNVFHTEQAVEVERILAAVAEPGRESLVRAALATEMLGVAGEALHRLSEDEQTWEAWLETFQDYHRLWREHGFIRMFRALSSRQAVAGRLLRFRDGERRLTNLLHLSELLQDAAVRARLGMEGLLKWLGERRRSRSDEDEEHQLRLESDEQLVKIVTVHKSKGLEYPIVFCPFLWDGKLWSTAAEAFTFHDPQNADRLVLDFGSERQHEGRDQARQEELAENLRLLYVALTRARCQCYLAWGSIRAAGSAAPAWLLHPHPGAVVSLDSLSEYVERLPLERRLADLREVAKRSGGAIRIEPPPEESAPYRPPARREPPLAARRFSGPLRAGWRVGSFTALTAGLGAELPDYDAGTDREAQMAPEEEARTVFTFPRGARAGSCLHAILERLDFTRTDRVQLEALVDGALSEHGFASTWMKVVAGLMERVLATPLNEDGLCLGSVSRERRLSELEFYYPLVALEAAGLRRLLERHGGAADGLREALAKLDFTPLHGYMKGFIDLVFEAGGRFYVVDYKSNWLGAAPEAYRAERLAEAMVRESYHLQYLIYTLAVHRYLRLRLPHYDYERCFGGVFYLFLRGMDPALGPGFGIFRDRPGRALVEALDAYVAAGRVG